MQRIVTELRDLKQLLENYMWGIFGNDLYLRVSPQWKLFQWSVTEFEGLKYWKIHVKNFGDWNLKCMFEELFPVKNSFSEVWLNLRTLNTWELHAKNFWGWFLEHIWGSHPGEILAQWMTCALNLATTRLNHSKKTQVQPSLTSNSHRRPFPQIPSHVLLKYFRYSSPFSVQVFVFCCQSNVFLEKV